MSERAATKLLNETFWKIFGSKPYNQIKCKIKD